MPVYRYVCGKKPKEERCRLADLPDSYFDEEQKYPLDFDEENLTAWTEDGKIDVEETRVVQLVHHGMFEDVEIACPACGEKAIKIIGKVTSYFPGNCYLNKEDCRKQMLLHKLKTNDPYAHMRPEGDKEDLVKRIKRGNKEPSKNFYPGGKGGLKAPSPHRPGT